MLGVREQFRHEPLPFGNSLDLQRDGLGRLFESLHALFQREQGCRRLRGTNSLAMTGTRERNESPADDANSRNRHDTLNYRDDRDSWIHCAGLLR